MRRLILTFACVAPIALVMLWHRSPLAAIGVLMLSHALILIPTLCPNVRWLGPVVNHFETDEREVWLTIDDGPEDDTEEVLRVLEKHQAKATFFVKGELVRAHPDRLRNIVEGGHTIGNHSETHPAGSFWCLPPSRIAREVDHCSEALRAAVGSAPSWFRAPVGMKNPAVHPCLAKRGMRLIGWSVRGLDGVSTDVERIVHRIVPRVRPGFIIVMHQGRETSAHCIDRVVTELTNQGFSFVVPTDAQLR